MIGETVHMALPEVPTYRRLINEVTQWSLRSKDHHPVRYGALWCRVMECYVVLHVLSDAYNILLPAPTIKALITNFNCLPSLHQYIFFSHLQFVL